MKRIIRKITSAFQKIIDRMTGSGLMQTENDGSDPSGAADAGGRGDGEESSFARSIELLRSAAAEGCVLVRNDGTLPLSPDDPVAVFGRCQLDWFNVGYGSGGNVHPYSQSGFMDALDSAGVKYDKEVAAVYRSWTSEPKHKADHGWWGHWPYSHPEMPLDPLLVSAAAERCSAAIVIIGRAAGEDRDNRLEKGSYYLTDAELSMLHAVTSNFKHTVVVLNTGNVIDMSWLELYHGRIGAVLFAWLGGMESGNAAADVLFGRVSPSGLMPCTVAKNYDDYPTSDNFGGRSVTRYAEGIYLGYRYFDRFSRDSVLWPFGYGLSYSDFSVELLSFAHDEDPDCAERGVRARLAVRNIGSFPARHAVTLWCSQPDGRLDKPFRVLAAFGKTRTLAPGETAKIELFADLKSISSYDERLSSFVLEKGRYTFSADGCVSGENPSPSVPVGEFTLEKELTVEVAEPVCTPKVNVRERILSRLPHRLIRNLAAKEDPNDYAHEPGSIEAFADELSGAELELLTHGHGHMNSPLGTQGNAGVFGGITEGLRKKGILPICCCDGPAGLRIARRTFLLPCGTALAAAFNTDTVRSVHTVIAGEMKKNDVHVILAPGMNLMRDPLCGRNFEYYSEDPMLSGTIASAAVTGIQSSGLAACPKHFACNNQEYRRSVNDSRVSERALRELYLRNFEICVRTAHPLTIMTSYNKINGIWSHYNYDLATTVLRGEWGFDGVVMTDWWMQKAKSPEFPLLANNAYRVRAQVDVLMPGGLGRTTRRTDGDRSIISVLDKADGLTRAELERSAVNVIRLSERLKKSGAENAE